MQPLVLTTRRQPELVSWRSARRKIPRTSPDRDAAPTIHVASLDDCSYNAARRPGRKCPLPSASSSSIGRRIVPDERLSLATSMRLQNKLENPGRRSGVLSYETSTRVLNISTPDGAVALSLCSAVTSRSNSFNTVTLFNSPLRSLSTPIAPCLTASLPRA